MKSKAPKRTPTDAEREHIRAMADASPVGAGATGRQLRFPGDDVIYVQYLTRYGELWREAFEEVATGQGEDTLIRIEDGEFYTMQELPNPIPTKVSSKSEPPRRKEKKRPDAITSKEEVQPVEKPAVQATKKPATVTEAVANEDQVGEGGTFFGTFVNDLDKSNKDFGKEMANQGAGTAILGGITSAFAEAGIGALKAVDTTSDLMAFGMSLVLEPTGATTKAQTQEIADRLDKRIAAAKQVVDVVTSDPGGVVSTIHEKGVDSMYRAMIGESSGWYDLSKATTIIVLGVVGGIKAKGLGDAVEEAAEAGVKSAVKSSRSPKSGKPLRGKGVKTKARTLIEKHLSDVINDTLSDIHKRLDEIGKKTINDLTDADEMFLENAKRIIQRQSPKDYFRFNNVGGEITDLRFPKQKLNSALELIDPAEHRDLIGNFFADYQQAQASAIAKAERLMDKINNPGSEI